MKNNRNLILLLIFVLTIIINTYPQSDNSIIEEIDAAIKSTFGTDFNLQAVETVDSSYQYSNWGFPLFDQYGTLENSYIFIAIKDKEESSQVDVGILGIYKNSQIVWNSGPNILTEDLSGAEIIAVVDLNRDGEVDIVTAWMKWVSSDIYDIWIYSWDGSNGTLITELNEDDKSSITGLDIVLLDRDGDGILELCGNAGCYSWNGGLYGNWDNQPFPEFVPKDALEAEINCKVVNIFEAYRYEYSIINNVNSIQRIEQFGIDAESENITDFTKPENWDLYYIGNESFISSEIEPPVDSHPNALIQPGEEKGNYAFISSGLPKISNIYIQGYNGERDFEVENIRSNSFVTQTLAPSNPSDSLIQMAFLDTLLNYNQRSLQLGWITNQTTADKYDSLLNTAKTLLEGNHIPWVEYTLQSVIDECNEDSSGNITSEAYALLRYNTEYLLENLPEIISPVLTSISPGIVLRYTSGGIPPIGLTVTATGANFSDSSVAYFNGSAKATTVVSDTVLTFPISGSEMSTLGNYPVWISTYGINSDTLTLSVVDNLITMQLFIPTLQCVRNNGGGSYTAYFGYVNHNNVDIYVPLGSKNKFAPFPIDKGQPKLFLPGTHTNVFSVNFNGRNLIWTLDQTSVTANRSSTPCP